MTPDQMPLPQIHHRLRRLRVRFVAIESARALLWAFGGLMVGGWLAAGVEAIAYLPPIVRLVPPGLVVLGAVIVAGGVLRVGLKGVRDTHSMALYVEKRVPSLRQRLITALELDDSTPCSEALLAITRDEALQSLLETSPEQIASRRRPRFAFWAAAAALVITVILGSRFPDGAAGIAHRWAHPTLAFSPPQQTHVTLEMATGVVVAGDDLDLHLAISGDIPTTATLRRRYVGETAWLEEELLVEERASEASAEESGTEASGYIRANARFAWDDVRQSFEVQGFAGDGETLQHTVKVIDPPVVTGLRLSFEYPDYSGLPARVEEEGGDLRALAGTAVRLEASSNKRLGTAEMVIDDSVRIPAQIVDRAAVVDWVLPAVMTHDARRHQYHIHLTDIDGIENREPIRYAIDILDDEVPVVNIVNPGHDADLPESQQVALGIEAMDDFGIGRIDLVYQINDGPPLRTRLGSPAEPRTSLHHIWDLTPHQLLPEDLVTYHAEAFDNDAVGGPKKGLSSAYTLRFPSLYELFDEVSIEQEQQLETLEEIAEQEQDAHDLVEQLRREVLKTDDLSWQEKKELDAALEAASERAEAVQELAREMAETMDQLEKSGLGSDQLLDKMEQIRELMAAVASPEMQEALEALQQAAQGELNPQELAEALREFQQDQQSFQERLDRTISLLQQIHAEQRLMAATEQAQDLEERQQQIDESLDAGDPSDAQRLADQEGRLAADTDRLQQELDELAEEMDQIHPPTSQGLKAQSQMMEQAKLNERMRMMEQQLDAGASQMARRQGEGLEEDLGRLSEAMQELQGEFSAGQRENLMGAIREIAADLLQLSFRQERLRRQIDTLDSPRALLEAPRQFALGSSLRRSIMALAEIGRQTMSLHPGLPTTLGYALQNAEGAAGHLSQKERHRALELQSEAMRRLNEAVLMLRESAKDLAQSKMPSGFAEAMERMMGLSQQQAALNEATQRSLQQQGRQQGQQGRGGQEEMMISRLAAEQRRIYQALSELERGLRGQRSLQERVGQIQKEMGDVLQQLEQRRPNQNLPQRQQRILQRMLDASRSIHARGFEKKRRSQVATQHAMDGPSWLPENLGQTPDRWRQAMGEALSGDYPAGYRRLVRRYYETVYSDLTQPEAEQP